MLAGIVQHLAEQQPATVAQARRVTTELVPGIDHGAWFCLFPQLVPGEELGEFFALRHCRLKVEQRHGCGTRHYQTRCLDGLGQNLRGEGVAQASEAVVEFEVSEAFHGKLRGAYPSILLE